MVMIYFPLWMNSIHVCTSAILALEIPSVGLYVAVIAMWDFSPTLVTLFHKYVHCISTADVTYNIKDEHVCQWDNTGG